VDKILLTYVPAIHRGYLELFERTSCPIGVLGSDVLSGWPELTRDVRALQPEQAVTFLQNRYPEVVLVGGVELAELVRSGCHFVLPNEDISHGLALRYLLGQKVEFVSLWLRWDRRNAESEREINPNRRISFEVFDQEMMSLAYSVAGQSSDWWRQVGAVLVVPEQTVLTAFNHHLPTAHSIGINGDPRSNYSWGEHIECSTAIHAEASVIAQAANRGVRTEGSLLYVTTFPCQTCARLVSETRVRRIYYCEGYSRADAQDILQVFGIELVRVDLPCSP